MTREITEGHFVVDFTVENRHEPSGHTYRQNKSVGCICATVERAIELVREVHPEATIHVVRRVGNKQPLILDKEGLTDE